jgi:choline dehydrogenase-like flavoprotein
LSDAAPFDLIIVGSGAGGGTLAQRLAPTGKRILILERGEHLPREADNWSAKAVFLERRYRTKEKWYDRHGRPFSPNTHYWVGGNTTFYGAALMRLRERDFQEVRHGGGVSPAWPISLEDLAPYYAEAERLWKVHPPRAAGLAAVPPARRHRPRRPEVAEEPLHPLPDLRRLSVPPAGQVGRADARG